LVELGINHEEQHHELILTDAKHVLWTNPSRPVYRPREGEARSVADTQTAADASRAGSPTGTPAPAPAEGRQAGRNAPAARSAELRWIAFEGGMREIGAAGAGFRFDNERPSHRVWLEPWALASRLTTCAEYLRFMADGGYERPELWLADG